MSENGIKTHIPVPKNTPAFFCADCGAVALDPDNVCRSQGRGTKSDWCGTQSQSTPSYCRNKKNNTRYVCKNCGQVAVNPQLLCDPEQMPMPE